MVIKFFKTALYSLVLTFSMQGCTQIWDEERTLQDNFQGLDGGLLSVYDDRTFFFIESKR